MGRPIFTSYEIKSRVRVTKYSNSITGIHLLIVGLVSINGQDIWLMDAPNITIATSMAKQEAEKIAESLNTQFIQHDDEIEIRECSI